MVVPVLTESDELPVAPQSDVPLWSENYCFDAFDGTSGNGLWMHLGRWSKAPQLWREQTKLFLSDGSLLLWKTFGQGDETSGPRSASLSFQCVEPGTAWRLRFDGACRHVTLDELSAGALPDAPVRRLEAEFSFTSAQPAWDLGDDAGHQIWCDAHYEQHGRVSGAFQVDGEEFILEAASAYRDHSRGPRNMKAMRRHAWVHAQTDDDRAFGMFYMEVQGQPGLARAIMVEDGQLEEVDVVGPPFADSVDVLRNDFGFGLQPSGRPAIEVRAHPVNSVVSSFVYPYEKLHGIAQGASHVSCHQTTLFTFDGAPAVGHTERAFALEPALV